MTEIKHIYNGMTPIYSIYDGPGSATDASNITFYRSPQDVIYYNRAGADSIFGVARGTSSIDNANFQYLLATSPFSSFLIGFKISFIKEKTPINITINGVSVSINRFFDILGSSNEFIRFYADNIPLASRVSATSLTKTIDFELVDNIQATFTERSQSFIYLISSGNIANITYYKSDYHISGDRRKYFIQLRNQSSKTATHIVSNGREFPASNVNNNYGIKTNSPVTHLFHIPTSSNLSFGINAKFSDGTYLNNTRSKLFARDTRVQIYRRPVVPVITSFSVTPTTIDLDDRLTGTISFSLGVTGTAGQVTTARIIRVRDNAQIGTTFTGGSGLNLSQTLPNIAQPLRTETYRLIATNTDGNAHRDTTVTVTKNPTLTNCRRTNYIDATTLYEFAFTLTGLPRPSVRYVFTQNNIAGQQGQVPYSHYAQGSNPYTFNVTGWRINFANSNARSLRLTASNSSGSSSCVINNIND